MALKILPFAVMKLLIEFGLLLLLLLKVVVFTQPIKENNPAGRW